VNSRVFGIGEFKYAIRIFKRAQELLLRQPNLGKISQNCTNISYVQEIETFFVSIVGFSGSAKSSMLRVSAFQGSIGI